MVLISIHPMFLLIAFKRQKKTNQLHFNTSHVSINPDGTWKSKNYLEHFNTSHVSINRILP